MIRLYLKEWREHKNLSQVELSERAGVAATTISRLELQQMRWSSEQIEKFALALDLDNPRDLLFAPGDSALAKRP